MAPQDPGARLRRILIPALVSLAALALVLIVALAKPRGQSAESEEESAETAASGGAETPAPANAADAANASSASTDGSEPAAPAADGVEPARTFTSLRAVAPDPATSGPAAPGAALGSLDPAVSAMQVRFSLAGAGVSEILFSDIWETAGARRQAERWREAGGAASNVEPPDETLRYRLQDQGVVFRGRDLDGDGEVEPETVEPVTTPLLAASRLVVNGTSVNLHEYTRDATGEKVWIWSERGPGHFETVVRDETGADVLRLTRRFALGSEFDIRLEQSVENLTDAPLDVRFVQHGPCDLRLDRARYMDLRRFAFGSVNPLQPAFVVSDDNLRFDRGQFIKRWDNSLEALAEGKPAEALAERQVWPNDTSRDRGYSPVWFGSTNRYFAFAIHPIEQGSATIDSTVERIEVEASNPDGGETAAEDRRVLTYLYSPEHTVPAGGSLSLDLGIYAGPLDRHVLGDTERPYRALGMQRLILYQMSSFCAWCTFQWLAVGLLGFLSFLHGFLFDWGVAIILLVIVVRTLLHPLTKRSQVAMQRFGKRMGELKPEMDKLQKKFAGDPKKLQQEQLRMMRERGVNPLHMLGCLPLFLQTPIWIALYAMLYFAFDLRQVPAFFGVFQLFWGWPFLADLSSADHFFWEFDEPFHVLFWNVSGINLLPILMGAIFYVQQKYMTPPPSPTMTREQLQQQKIMRVMMVVLFPLMLYSAPSGLTLYIMTSSLIGILESRYIRRHITALDLNPPAAKKPRSAVKPKDAMGHAYTKALERIREARRRRAHPEKKYKRRG